MADDNVVQLPSPEERQQDPGRWSVVGASGNPRFSAPKLGNHILDVGTYARSPDNHLYVYLDGAYQDNGEEIIRTLVQKVLGDTWKPSQSNEVVEWIRHVVPHLEQDNPPRHLIRVRNGLIDVSKGKVEFTEGDSSQLLTPIALPVTYDPEAGCELFKNFLRLAMKQRKALVELLFEILGYCLVPDNSRQKAFLHHGTGGNGKSVFLRVQEALVGSRNVSAWSLHDLADNRYAAADLYGKLINIYPDLSAAELSSSSKFRAITGGDSIMSEHKYRDAFAFRPYARLAFSANKYPAIRDPTSAMFDRWIVVPWDVRFRATEREDQELAAKLTSPDELSGILNLALRGLMRLARNGSFREVPAADKALADFKEKADTVRLFIRDIKEEKAYKSGDKAQRSHLWELYKDWCRETGHPGLSKSGFNERVEAITGREYFKDSAGYMVTVIP